LLGIRSVALAVNKLDLVNYSAPTFSAVAGEFRSDDLDVSRGAVIAAAESPPLVASRFESQVVWMSSQPLLPARSYLAKLGARTVGLRVDKPSRLNEIDAAQVHFDSPVAADPYAANRDLGGFMIIDRLTNATVGAGLIGAALPDNIRWQTLTVDKSQRGALKGHRGCIVWFIGLSGAGKSTIANLVEQLLHRAGGTPTCWTATMCGTG
jgi:bifunctional enzyme CysN/CysC